jgi:hypothetical protein
VRVTTVSTRGVSVECYAGNAYPTEPRAFTFRGTRHRVEQVERTWRAPGALWFRVRTDQDQVFTLAYFEDEYAWMVLPT